MAAKGKKNAPVKWAIGANEPDDLPDFQSNDDIVRKNKGKLPPKGRTRVLVKKIKSKPNKNGDQMLMVTCEIAEGTAKKPGPYDGYTMWTNLNVTEQGAPYLKRFLVAIGATWNDFINKTVADTTEEPAVINKIGKVNLAKPVEAFVSIKHGTDMNDEERAEPGRFLPPPDDDDELDDDAADDDEDEADDDIEVDEDSDDEDEDEDTDEESEDESDEDEDEDDSDDEDEDEEDEEDEEDNGEDELREELNGLKLPALKKRAIRAGAEADDLPGKKPALIDLIVELELGDEEDEDEDEADDDDSEVVDIDELKAELKELGLPELRDRCKENGRKPKELKGLKKPQLIALIIEDEAAPPF